MKSEHAQVKYLSVYLCKILLQRIGHGVYIKLRLTFRLVFMISHVQGVYLLADTTGLHILHGSISVEG